MLLKRNLLEFLTIICCSGSFICILLNYVTNISPITGVWFPIYTLFLCIVSLTCSFKFLQWLIRLNKPLKYDLEELAKEYPYLGFLSSVLPKLPKLSRHYKLSEEYKEYDTNELSVISTVLERKLVSSWYVPFISQEIGFPFACKQLLDQMIGKAFQICNKIETKEISIDICSVLIIHLKEYKKALKRHEKSPGSSIESLYKKVHPISDDEKKKMQSADHCVHILRLIFKELVPWELWDTPHSELLVRIMAKKLDNFVDTTISDPVWLNEKLLSILSEKNTTTESQDSNDAEADGIEVPVFEGMTPKEVLEDCKPVESAIESALSNIVSQTTAPILQRAINEDIDDNEVIQNDVVEETQQVEELNGSDPLEVQSSPVMRQRRGRQGKNEVKIYDRIIEGSVKTWETDMDLQCISLGQDLLASLDGEITLSRLWGGDAEPDGSPNPPQSKSPQPTWFGDEDTLDMELTDSSPKDSSPKSGSPLSKKDHSPKATEVLLKDLQTTVHQAKSKIGEMQVDTPLRRGIGVATITSGDEAAGMMEGLLDFGIAGLKKGLRFTGLSDDSQDKSPSHGREKGSTGSSPPALSLEHKMKLPLDKDAITSTLLLKEDNAYTNGTPPLVKQHRVTSQDSVLAQQSRRAEASLPILVPLADSPEPQYEEAADLSTSIAKLRSLLQQREPRSDDKSEENIWWEGAEETRGRAQQHHSSRPVDTATLADEYDMSSERNSSPGQSSNNMQRLFARTVTGVFNSLRTAVGEEQVPSEPPPGDHAWTYLTTSVEMSVGGAVARLVGSRRVYTHVDAALDSLEHLAPQSATVVRPPEDLEEWCAATGALWCACVELLCASGLLHSHVTHRIATLLLAELSESLLHGWLDELTVWLKKQIFSTFEQMARETSDCAEDTGKTSTKVVNVEKTCDAIMAQIPGPLYLFGEETLAESVHRTVSSLTHQLLNKDVIFRVLDVFALHFKHSAALRNPTFEN